MIDDKLLNALNELDNKLVQKGLTLDLIICGAFAIQLHGLTRSQQIKTGKTFCYLSQLRKN